jgi:hypothetical protein
MLAGGLALSSREASSPRLLAAGVAGGVVLVFKTVLGPVVIAMWVAAALFATAASGSARWCTFFRIALLLAAGCIIPVVIVSVWAYHNNILSDLVRVTFEFPFRFTLSESSEHFYPSLRSAQYFFHMVYWFGIRFGPLLVVSVIGARYLLKRRDAYGAVLAAWLMAATLIIGVQTWWEYQLFLLLPPVGLLAAAGIDWIMILPKSGKRTGLMVGSLVAISVALGIPLAEKAVALLRYGPVLSGPARLSYQSELFPLWGSIVQNVGFLSDPDALPGPIYVYDGPLYWLASGRELIKVPDHAYQLPEQRQHWPADIMRADPAYIRLPKEIRESFNRIDPSFQDLLDKRYRRLEGRPPWYIRKQSEW